MSGTAAARVACAAGFAALALLASCSSSDDPEPLAFRAPVLTPIAASTLPGFDRLSQMLVGDLNGDSRPDALLGHYNGAQALFSLSVFLGNGDGSFRAVEPVVDLWDANLADFNRDGRLDLVGCFQDGPQIRLGTGDGRTWTSVAQPPADTCEQTTVGDFDGDGNPDFAFGLRGAGPGLTRFQVALGNGNGTFRYAPVQTVAGFPDDRPGYFYFLPGNFNGDARTDLVVMHHSGGPLQPAMLASNGDGTFTKTWPTGALPEPFERRSVIAYFATDLDRDGRDDLLFWALGFLGFPPAPPLPGPQREGIALSMLVRGNAVPQGPGWTQPEVFSIAAAGDIDRDGRVDFLTWRVSGGMTLLFVSRGQGDGTFTAAELAATPATPVAGYTRIVDLNGDGKPDVLGQGGGSSLRGSSLAALLAE